MGQRHQAFAIARVRPHGSPPHSPPKYRCIAAYHHQWCYGRLPLLATYRLLTLVRQKENAEIVRAEIRNIDGKYGHYQEQPEIINVPCPFTAYLLGVSWDVDLTVAEDAYSSGVTFHHSLLRASMGSWDGDNNDGISVIDVTDPGNPAYCFALSTSTPLSGEQYMRAYYPVPTQSEDPEYSRQIEEIVLKIIALLDGEKMVTLDMLAEAWPDEYQSEAIERPTGDITDSTSTSTEPAEEAPIPSLAALTFPQAFDYALEKGDTIENILWLPGKLADTKSLLIAKSPFPDNAVQLLVKVLTEMKETTSVDLTDFALSSEQAVRVASQLPGLESLNLSFNAQITTDTVREILTAAPGLKRLVLMGCTSVTPEDLYDLLRKEPQLFYKLEALMHPALLCAAEPPPFPIAFTFMTNNETIRSMCGCSLALFTPAGVVDALAEVLRSIWSTPFSISSVDAGLLFEAVPTSRPRAPDVPWGARSVVAVPALSVNVFRAAEPGWAFLFQTNMFKQNKNWCFLRLVPTARKSEEAAQDLPWVAGGWEIHDVRSFVRITTAEGRPAPSEDAVQELEELLRHTPESGPQLHLMDREVLNRFMQSRPMF
ncbi:hypothetical protein SCP_0700750 [Sparassis crispa]|uniref:Uncharacterized protein n=1 Tax=Sparassis crispa TaxID=139825 RepID=A0A401GRP5_9APHY|nr:hypothetical protein SCP_0700750 [Sparassis crispa]GBE84895.1 hypothetical protein SCP_0700750 [Sparassis crispa]